MQIEHLPAEHRFRAKLPEGEAVLHYGMIAESLMDIQSTHVPSSGRGRGIAAALVREAFDFARDQGLRVRPSCWYVGTWVEKHPEYEELLEKAPY